MSGPTANAGTVAPDLADRLNDLRDAARGSLWELVGALILHGSPEADDDVLEAAEAALAVLDDRDPGNAR